MFRSILNTIRRRFEMLRAPRTRLRKQLDGDELDLEAYIDSHASFRAGLPMAQALYQTNRRSKRDLATMLLIDVSGSTDGWISANRRVIAITPADQKRKLSLVVETKLESQKMSPGATSAPAAAAQIESISAVSRCNRST